MDALHVIIGWSVLIVTLELILWCLFRTKVALMNFPTERCESVLCHLHSITVLRIFALLHTLVLVAAVLFVHLSLW